MYGIGFIPGFEVLDVVAKPEKVGGSISEWAVQSLLFNANYAFDNKYLAQLSFRRDGASNFGDNANMEISFLLVPDGTLIVKNGFMPLGLIY